jgi:hypothetical protein
MPDVESITITELGAAFGVHGGPGTLVVAVQTLLDPETFRTASRRQY